MVFVLPCFDFANGRLLRRSAVTVSPGNGTFAPSPDYESCRSLINRSALLCPSHCSPAVSDPISVWPAQLLLSDYDGLRHHPLHQPELLLVRGRPAPRPDICGTTFAVGLAGRARRCLALTHAVVPGTAGSEACSEHHPLPLRGSPPRRALHALYDVGN